MNTENLLNGTGIKSLLQDIKSAVARKKVEFFDNNLKLTNSNLELKLNGEFNTSVLRHEDVAKAVEDGDLAKERYLRNKLFETGGLYDDSKYVVVDSLDHTNILPMGARNFNLGLLLNLTVLKKTSFYPSAYSNDRIPDDSWDANWAGASSGPKATEIGASQLTVSSRQLAVFGSAASSSIYMSTPVIYTVKTGVTNLNAYGGTLNSSNVFGYDTAYDGLNGEILLAASRRATPFTGMAAGDKLSMSYTLNASST